MTERKLRIAVAGATGAVGSELVALLDERRFPVAELLPFATDRSLGSDVEIVDEIVAVEAEMPRLENYDLLFVCTPRAAALDLVRAALRAEVSCIDCSGALSHSLEVPLALAELSPASESIGAPLVASPPGSALAWCRTLAAIDSLSRVERVIGTVLQSASHAGSRGIDALSAETLALLRQQDAPESDVFPTEVAFDCVPRLELAHGDVDVGSDLAATVCRVLGHEVAIAATFVRVPTFVGEGSALSIELADRVDPEEVRAALDKTPGLASWTGGVGPSTRDAAGGDDVLVGGVRRDPSSERGLLLWLAADPVRLAALNAVKIAEARLRLH